MPFQKNNKLGFLPLYGQEALDKTPICFRAKQGVREKLKTVPDWQERLREFVEQLIRENSPQNQEE